MENGHENSSNVRYTWKLYRLAALSGACVGAECGCLYFFFLFYLGEFLPYPQRTLEILYELKQNASCIFIRGNKEDYWLNRRKDQNCDWKSGNRSVMAMIYNYNSLNAKDLDFFETLPISQSIRFAGMEPVLACHGTPFENQKALLSEELFVQKCEERYIICVHTHMQGFVSDGKKENHKRGSGRSSVEVPEKNTVHDIDLGRKGLEAGISFPGI